MKRDVVRLGLVGFILGAIWLGLMRSLLAYPDPVHYHANFGVFINGQRQPFDSPLFYEEVQACTQDDVQNPRGRVHLHQPDFDVVHVHDEAVTWGNFFENIGYSLSDSSLVADGQLYSGDDLRFVLNGQAEQFVANRIISSGDVLLVSYGTTELTQEYAQIQQNAEAFNESYDPGSCSGADQPSALDRLRYGFFN
jgi:hypothetical protein